MEKYKSKFKERNMAGDELSILVHNMLWYTEEDIYSDGAQPGTGSDWFEKIGKKFNSFQDMVKYVNRNYGVTDDLSAWGAFSGEDGRIEVQMMVDEQNVEATKKELEMWKRGQLRLWLANISFKIEFAKTYEPSAEEISKTFKIQIM